MTAAQRRQQESWPHLSDLIQEVFWNQPIQIYARRTNEAGAFASAIATTAIRPSPWPRPPAHTCSRCWKNFLEFSLLLLLAFRQRPAREAPAEHRAICAPDPLWSGWSSNTALLLP